MNIFLTEKFMNMQLLNWYSQIYEKSYALYYFVVFLKLQLVTKNS